MGRGASKKGFIKNMSNGTIKNFLFNPSTISDEIAMNFKELGGGGANKKYQYVGRDNRTIDLELFLKSKDPSQIEDFKNFLEGFIPFTRFKAPPLMLFCFGTYIKKCMVLNIKRNWTEFDEQLKVTEMKVTLALKEVG
jgi:hypothetical protein